MTNSFDADKLEMALEVDVPKAWKERDEMLAAFVAQVSIGLMSRFTNELQGLHPDLIGMDQKVAMELRWAQELTAIGAAFGISIRPTRIERDPQG